EMIRVPGFHDAGIARAEEAGDTAQAGALRDQRLDQGLGLGAGLSPDNPVSRPDDAAQSHHRRDYGCIIWAWTIQKPASPSSPRATASRGTSTCCPVRASPTSWPRRAISSR